MPLFRYKAVDPAGELLKGEMELRTQNEVIERLRDQGLLPISVEETAPGLRASGLRLPGLRRRHKVSTKEITVFTQQLANLLNAGLPLDRALTILINVTEEGEIKALLSRLQEEVRGGSSLGAALEKQAVFSRLYINMVRAGEAGGSVEVVLARLAEFMERSRALKESVKSALIYPIILLAVAGLSVIILLTFVVPQFQQLFEDAGQALPLATQIVIAAGEIVQKYWWVGLLLIAAGALYMNQQLSRPESRYRWDRLFLKMPVVGDLIAKVEMARFSRTLGTLLGNGVSLLMALSIVKETLTNQVMATSMSDIADKLKAGKRLAEPMLEANVFPRLAVHMIQVGEETGQLEPMLLKVADTYDAEVKATVDRALALLEPVLILGLGLVIAGIIMSILLAILGLNQLAF